MMVITIVALLIVLCIMDSILIYLYKKHLKLLTSKLKYETETKELWKQGYSQLLKLIKECTGGAE